MLQKSFPLVQGRTIRCILFDFGSTLWTQMDKGRLYQLEQVANQQAVSLLRTHAAPETLPALDDTTLGNEIHSFIERGIREKKRYNAELEPDFALITQEALSRIGIVGLPISTCADLFEAMRVRSYDSRVLFPDTLSTLATLKERGFALGIVTNRIYGGPPFQEDVRNFGFLPYIDLSMMAVSADLGVRKPHPDIFLHALNHLGIPAEEAAMVGDSLSADVGGAKRLNIFSIWKPKSHLIAEAKAAMRTHPSNTESLDDFLVTYVRTREGKRKYALELDTKPDMIIEHLHELLDVFPQVGTQ